MKLNCFFLFQSSFLIEKVKLFILFQTFYLLRKNLGVMDFLTTLSESVPFIKRFADQQKINPNYILIFLAIASVIIIQKTFFGSILAGILCLYMPIKDSILSIQSPNPKINDLKRLLTVFVVFSAFYLLECVGFKRIIPIFSIIKILAIFWVGYDEKHANACNEILFSKIPTEWLHCGNSIETAVKKAAKSVENNISIKKNSIEIKKE